MFFNNISIDINNKTHNEHYVNKFNNYFVNVGENITLHMQVDSI